MKAVFIGVDVQISEIATMAVHLRWPDVTPHVATSAEEGLEFIAREIPDVVLVHPDFEDMTLAKAIREIRRFSNAPMVVFGREGDEMEAVASLELGADDYVRPTCHLPEIMLRIWVLLRRVGIRPAHESDSPIRCGRLFINPGTFEAFLDERRITLTSTEFRLLYRLVKNRGRVVEHQALASDLWGEEIDARRLVKKYVQRLRRKLEDDAREPTWIVSVHGVGYRFAGPQPNPTLTGRTPRTS